MSGAPYAYRLIGVRIPTIRLVRITGRREDGSVLLQLECFPLADVIDKYIAISYTWGPDNKIRRVWIGTKYVVIRENIWQFLLHCAQHQHIVSDSWLWIDSICINQTNTAEKNRQVQLMGRIFSGAAHVLIWLGSSSQRNLKLLEDACTSATQNDNHTKAQSSDHRYESEIMWSWQEWRSFVKSDDESRVGDWWRPYVDDVKDVLYNEYWHRLWIAQEVKLAQSAKLIFGTMTLDIQQLESINLLYETLRDEQRSVDEQYYRFSRSKTPATNIVSQHPLLCRGAPSLHKFLFIYRNQQCADPRDKVYGLLGLAGIDGTFAIDYTCAKEKLLVQVLDYLGTQPLSSSDLANFQDIKMVRLLSRALETTPNTLSEWARLSSSTPLGRAVATSKYTLTLKLQCRLVPCSIDIASRGVVMLGSPGIQGDEIHTLRKYMIEAPVDPNIPSGDLLVCYYGHDNLNMVLENTSDKLGLVCFTPRDEFTKNVKPREARQLRSSRLENEQSDDKETTMTMLGLPREVSVSLTQRLTCLRSGWDERNKLYLPCSLMELAHIDSMQPTGANQINDSEF